METTLKMILKLLILVLAIVSTYVGSTESTRPDHSEVLQKYLQPYPSYVVYHPDKWCCGKWVDWCCDKSLK